MRGIYILFLVLVIVVAVTLIVATRSCAAKNSVARVPLPEGFTDLRDNPVRQMEIMTSELEMTGRPGTVSGSLPYWFVFDNQNGLVRYSLEKTNNDQFMIGLWDGANYAHYMTLSINYGYRLIIGWSGRLYAVKVLNYIAKKVAFKLENPHRLGYTLYLPGGTAMRAPEGAQAQHLWPEYDKEEYELHYDAPRLYLDIHLPTNRFNEAMYDWTESGLYPSQIQLQRHYVEQVFYTVNAVWYERAYLFDTSDNVIGEKLRGGRKTGFQYDDQGRLNSKPTEDRPSLFGKNAFFTIDNTVSRRIEFDVHLELPPFIPTNIVGMYSPDLGFKIEKEVRFFWQYVRNYLLGDPIEYNPSSKMSASNNFNIVDKMEVPYTSLDSGFFHLYFFTVV